VCEDEIREYESEHQVKYRPFVTCVVDKCQLCQCRIPLNYHQLIIQYAGGISRDDREFFSRAEKLLPPTATSQNTRIITSLVREVCPRPHWDKGRAK